MKSEFPSKVMFQKEIYNSVAHAYIAAKTPEDSVMRRRILKAPTYKDMIEISGIVETTPQFMH